MLTGVGSVAILVNDTKKAVEWYNEKLGFEVVENKGHTVYLKARGDSFILHLCGKCGAWEKDRPGGRTGIWFHCGEVTMRRDAESGQLILASDPVQVEKTYQELKAKGVEFSEELTTTGWGKYAIFRDPDGNELEMS